jgi:hypothetical protein
MLREHHPTVREQLAEVVEEDHAVAQEAMVWAASRSGLSADGH